MTTTETGVHLPALHHVQHRDGIPWNEAQAPRRLHRCKVQTKGWRLLTRFEHCACGAVRVGSRGRWTGRNSRRTTRRAAVQSVTGGTYTVTNSDTGESVTRPYRA